MKTGDVDFRDLKKLEERLSKELDVDALCRKLAGQIAAMLLNEVKKRTPVGVAPDVDAETYEEYWSGYTGGSLRDAWRLEPLVKQGDQYTITLINNKEYASYVEYGHRQTPGRYVPALGKSLKASWVEGKFMMTISAQRVADLAPQALRRELERALKEAL